METEKQAIQPPTSNLQDRLRRSVFWKVAGTLVAMLVATGLMAVVLSAWFAYDRSKDLAANSLSLRLDGLAEEVEQRAGSALLEGVDNLPAPLRNDLSQRFPDPVRLIDINGTPVATLMPDATHFAGAARTPEVLPPVPDNLATLLDEGRVVVQLDDDAPEGSWGLAPVYTPDDFLAGGLLIQPLTFSLARELEGTRTAFQRALMASAVLAVVIALVLGSFYTSRLLKPLRDMTGQVERIGAGDYAARLEAGSDDEIGRLSGAINQMATAVEESVERLRATDRLRRELVANVGHDLRTPLAALLGYLEEAERRLGEERYEAARQALNTARRQSVYLNRLISDLFELSLLDSARPPLRREPVPLGELLTDAANAHRAAFVKAGIAFLTEVPKDLPTLYGDGVRLLRVLDNLLANACRHTPAGSTTILSALATECTVEIIVRDTGEGMAPEELEHIFERYYRGEEARTRRGQSTGLGLSIARAIARAHGGDLTAASTPGEGSIFTVRLPRDEPTVEHAG